MEDVWTSQGVRDGFLEEVVHKLIEVSNMKRELCQARGAAVGRFGGKCVVSVRGTERY